MNLRERLSASGSSVFFICYATIAAFLTYTAMYAVRKTFTAGSFSGISFLNIDYKIWLVTAQLIGYTISKFIGVKIVAETGARYRGRLITGLVSFSVLALLGFALAPAPYGIIFLLLNGLPIGMIFGLVFNYLEGRRVTEILVVGLTITQVFSSGFVKTLGSYAITSCQLPEQWMPFLVGLLAMPVLLLGVWMLNQIPPQTQEDIILKSARKTMNRQERISFIYRFITGLGLFLVGYILMTSYRDFRDNFSTEIWSALGYGNRPGIFTITEIPISVIILLMMILIQRINNNMRAFMWIHILGISGALIALLGTLLFLQHTISAPAWISITGIGLYLAYVPANTVFIERMIAVFRYPANAGFVVILADFFGYCGSLSVLFYKNFGNRQMSYADFFIAASILVPVLLIITQTLSAAYFFQKKRKEEKIMAAVL